MTGDSLDPHRYFFVSSLFFIVILFSGQNISWFFILGGKVFLVHCQFGQYVYYESGKCMYKFGWRRYLGFGCCNSTWHHSLLFLLLNSIVQLVFEYLSLHIFCLIRFFFFLYNHIIYFSEKFFVPRSSCNLFVLHKKHCYLLCWRWSSWHVTYNLSTLSLCKLL